MRILYFDTETTGLLPRRGEGGENPHLVQLGALLVADGHESALFSCLIKPDGWEIPAEATNIHGITNEMCHAAGLELVDALSFFLELTRLAGKLVAHNYEFDACLLDIEYRRLGQQGFLFNDGRQFCTMKAATDICKIQGTHGGNGESPRAGSKLRTFVKYPKLTEAHEFFLGQPFEGVHTAIGDVKACRAVHDAMQIWIENFNKKAETQVTVAGSAI